MVLFLGLVQRYCHWKKTIATDLKQWRNSWQRFSARRYQRWLIRRKFWLRVKNVFWNGASIPPKPRTGNPSKDLVFGKAIGALRWLFILEQKIFYPNRPYSTKANGRVRSKLEQKFANWLTDKGFNYKYEAPLEIEGKVLHPDFHLIDHDIFVEVWGMMFDPKYRGIHQAKKELYSRSKTRVIDIYGHSPDKWSGEFWKQFSALAGNQVKPKEIIGSNYHQAKVSHGGEKSSQNSKPFLYGGYLNMRNLLVAIIVIVVIGAIGIWTFPWFGDRVSETRTTIDGTFRKGVSDDYLFQKQREQLEIAQKGLVNEQFKVLEAEQALNQQRQTLRNQQVKLNSVDEAIKARHAWLTAPGRTTKDKYLHSGNSYSYETVVQDLNSRVEQAKSLRQSISLLEKTAVDSQRAIADGKEAIQQALSRIRIEQGDLQAKELQTAVLRMAEETMQIAKGIKTSVSTNYDPRYAKEIERRNRERQAALMVSESSTDTGGFIPLYSGRDDSMLKVESYFSEYLNDRTSEVPEVYPETESTFIPFG